MAAVGAQQQVRGRFVPRRFKGTCLDLTGGDVTNGNTVQMCAHPSALSVVVSIIVHSPRLQVGLQRARATGLVVVERWDDPHGCGR